MVAGLSVSAAPASATPLGHGVGATEATPLVETVQYGYGYGRGYGPRRRFYGPRPFYGPRRFHGPRRFYGRPYGPPRFYRGY